MHRVILATGLLSLLVLGGNAAERQWRPGTWTDVSVHAMANGRIYVIETETLRIELKDVVPNHKPTLDPVVGRSVTFALDKKTAYIRAADGTEHKLRVTRQTTKHPE